MSTMFEQTRFHITDALPEKYQKDCLVELDEAEAEIAKLRDGNKMQLGTLARMTERAAALRRELQELKSK